MWEKNSHLTGWLWVTLSSPAFSLLSIPQVRWWPYPYGDPFDLPSCIDDDNLAVVDDPSHAQIGIIQAELKRGTRNGSTKRNRATDGFDGTEPSTELIHERSKKAGSHRVV